MRQIFSLSEKLSSLFLTLKIRHKLRLLLFIPCSAILVFGCLQTAEYYQNIKQARQAKLSVSTSLIIDSLIFELQKERGITEGFLAEHTATQLERLKRQRNRTDQKLVLFHRLSENILQQNIKLKDIASHRAIKTTLSLLANSSKQLTDYRQKINSSQSFNYFDYYSTFIKQLLNLIQQVQVNLKHVEQNRLNIVFIKLLQLQEKAGQERGALNGVLLSKNASTRQLQQVMLYVHEQDIIIEDLFSIPTTEYHSWLDNFSNLQYIKDIKPVRNGIIQSMNKASLLNEIEYNIGYKGIFNHLASNQNESPSRTTLLSLLDDTSKKIKQLSQISILTTEEKEAISKIENVLKGYQQYVSSKPVGASINIYQWQLLNVNKSLLAHHAIDFLKQHKLKINSLTWWQLASARIASFHQISTQLSKKIEHIAHQEEQHAIAALVAYFFSFVIIFIVTLYLSFLVVKRIVGEIKHIGDAMKKMQTKHEFNIPLTIEGADEINEMANAFNQMLLEREKTEADLKISAAVFNYASEAIMVTNANDEIERVNPAFCKVSGYTQAQVLGKSPDILNSDSHEESNYQHIEDELEKRNSWQGELWKTRKNGEVYPVYQATSIVRNKLGKKVQTINLFSDITKRKKYEEDIWTQANYDELTGLPNRNLCLERLRHEFSIANHHETKLSLLFIDLDRFKNINDTWGHNSGDQLLKMAAVRLSHCLRASDTIARFGGDEFVVILSGATEKEAIEKIAANISLSLSTPFCLSDNNEAVVSASIGITLAPKDGVTPEILLKNADTAMYQAKESGRNTYRFFTPSMNKVVTERMHTEQELRKAIKNQEFILHYQPVVSLTSGKIVGAEALIRWQHPTRGLIYPDSFISIAEETGLIEPIGQWVIESATAELAHWHSLGLELQVAVNVSSRQCRLGSKLPISKVIVDALTRHNIKPCHLKVEITESLLMDNSQQMIDSLQEIRDLGVAIHMDDFGTGYSSLSYLKHFPIDVLKIDRSFISGAIDDKVDASLVEAVVLIGHSLNLKLVGEGIETLEHFNYLKQLGCDYGQGYFIAKPLNSVDFLNHVKSKY